VRDLLETLERAGFVEVQHVSSTGVATSRYTKGATFRARKPRA